MQIGPYVEALQHDLANVAAVSDPEAAEIIRRVAAALESSVRLRFLHAVTEAANELTSQLPNGHVEVRLQDGDPVLVFVEETAAVTPAPEDALSARITLRLPETLKASVEAAAAREGVSVNSWLIHAIGRHLETRPRRSGRLTGFARS